ncbi:hypothetical protein ACJU26_05795 [Acidithiobacillus sp. M4-SHS-6]|uniref:hypothetical protein n=1 Tax=Acidithiobacillus sp. M4-SHS-6 TaxID=3383024 RepID=UPI0039BE930B
MYSSPFDTQRFPDAPAVELPDTISLEGKAVLLRLRTSQPDPVMEGVSSSERISPPGMAMALARAIFDHESARLTLDLPDDRMDLPVALHQDDPRLLKLLDTARRIYQHDGPERWPMLMDMALEAVQVETAQVMALDGDGLQARDLDNQNLPLYETIHEDMLDNRLETRYQGILNQNTLKDAPGTVWSPPPPGTYRGVLPVRPSPMPPDGELPPPQTRRVEPVNREQPRPDLQPQPTMERSTPMPESETSKTPEAESAGPRTTETGLRLQDIYLPDIHQNPMRIDAAFQQSEFIRAFYNQTEAMDFMAWINDQSAQREALDQNAALTLGRLQYVPAGVPGEYRAVNAETGQPVDRQIIDRQSLHDLLHVGKLPDDLAQQWQAQPELLAPQMQALVTQRQRGTDSYRSVVQQIGRYDPDTGQSVPAPAVETVAPAPAIDTATPAMNAAPAGMMMTAAEQQAADARAAAMPIPNAPNEMEYTDENTASRDMKNKSAPANQWEGREAQHEGQEAQQKGQEAQQKGQENQQKDQKTQQENQTKQDGQNQKDQRQDQNAKDAQKPSFSLFSRVHQHHHYQAPAEGAPAEGTPAEGKSPAEGTPAEGTAASNSPAKSSSKDPIVPHVSRRDTLDVMNMLNEAPVTPDEIQVMNNRVKKEGLTPEVQDGIQSISERGQRDVKNGKVTPEQMQKNAHALNELGYTVSQQPDSEGKQKMMEHIRRLGQMLVEAIKRIFHLGSKASAGPSM